MSTASHTLGTTFDPALGRAGHGILGVLTGLESLRLAKNPIFLCATALGVFFTAMALIEQAGQASGDKFGLPVVALTVGLGAMIAANQRTRSFQAADELVEVAPTPATTRTAALCLAVLVPGLVASGWLLLRYVVNPSALNAPEWVYGTFSGLDVAWVFVGNSVVAAAGGTLLCVAAGRWWRFRGASVVLVLAVASWSLGIGGALNTGGAMPSWQRWVHLFSPVPFFTTTSQRIDSVDSFPGSPAWHLVWLVTLCGLAAIAALLWRAEESRRRLLTRIGALTLAVSAAVYVLAAAGSVSQTVRTYPDGRSVVLTLTP